DEERDQSRADVSGPAGDEHAHDASRFYPPEPSNRKRCASLVVAQRRRLPEDSVLRPAGRAVGAPPPGFGAPTPQRSPSRSVFGLFLLLTHPGSSFILRPPRAANRRRSPEKRRPMVSSSQQFERIRKRKATTNGKWNKRARRRLGTPAFPIHPEGYDPKAA